MTPIAALDALASTPWDADGSARILALSQFFSVLHRSNDAHLLSIYAGDATAWNSPELVEMPPARRWIPLDDAQGYPALFFDTELMLSQRSGAAIDRAATYISLPLETLRRTQEPREGMVGQTLSEQLILTLNNEWSASRLCENLWKDRRIGEASKAIYALSFEGDNYLLFVGPGDLDEPCIVICGEQPFESLLYAQGTPESKPNQLLPETSEINQHTVEALNVLPSSWWDELVSSGLHTLLRATLMQMAIPGQKVDILDPSRAPSWRNVPMLPTNRQ